MTALAVETIGLSRRYGRRWALSDVSLGVPAGSVVMLAGRNGSGKSTLLRVLATALRPDHGSARVAGHDVRHERDQVRRAVALLGHHSFHYEALTALENLGIAARFLGRPTTRGAARARSGSRRARTTRSRASPPACASAWRSRACCCRTPRSCCSTSPTASSTRPASRCSTASSRELRSRAATVIMATHLVDRGRALCDHALLLEEGRLAWSGAARPMPAEAPGGSARA